MDDVNMSSLICEEDISKELQQFNVKLEDREVLAKLKNICLIYDFSAEKLVGEWLGFCSKRTWSTDLDQAKVELFENEGFRQEKLKLDSETKFRCSETEKGQPQIQLDADMLNDYGVTLTEEEIKKSEEANQQKTNDKANDKADDVTTNGNDHPASDDQQPSQNTKTGQAVNQTNGQLDKSTADCVAENQLNECVELGDNQTVLSQFGERLSAQQWINGAKGGQFTVQPYDPELHIVRAYKTSQIKHHESNEILNEMIDEMSDLVRDRLRSSSVESADGESNTDNLFVGRVNLEGKETKTLLFENPRFRLKKLRLDLSRVPSYSLFPGQLVCFDGELVESSDSLIVNRFVDNCLLLPPFTSRPACLTDGPLHLMLASGPLAPSMSDDLTSLEHLLEQVRLLQPHYLILLGPFFDCRNDYLLFNCDGEKFFNSILHKISAVLQEIVTEAILVPSTFDLNNYNIFPAPPFEHDYPKIHPKIRFMPNPSFLDLNGVVISLSSVDIVRHLIREEVKSTDSNQDRICEHLLTQRSLYPLMPPNPEVNLEFAKLDFIRFHTRPHLFVLPSMIKSFVRSVHGSLFVNPEYISKGCYAKVRIDSPPAGHTGSLAEHMHIEIIKHKPLKH